MISLPFATYAGSITAGPLDIVDLLDGTSTEIQGVFEAGSEHSQDVTIKTTESGLIAVFDTVTITPDQLKEAVLAA